MCIVKNAKNIPTTLFNSAAEIYFLKLFLSLLAALLMLYFSLLYYMDSNYDDE